MEERAAEGGLAAPGLQAAGGRRRRRCSRRLLHERPGSAGAPATELLSHIKVRRTGTLLNAAVLTKLRHTVRT